MALWAAMLGYALDAMDVLLYTLAVQVLKTEFHMDNAVAGLVNSATLLCSAVGGLAAGILADRIGRRRTLMYTILLYSLASGGTALATGVWSLAIWRGLVGLGLGAEWSAGAVLVAESWPAENRGKAIGLMQSGWAIGYMVAAALTGLILPHYGWRVLFVIGIAPALLTVWIRNHVSEPEIWIKRGKPGRFGDIFRAPYGRRTLLATLLATCVLFAYWGLFTWLPGFLSAPVASGGAALSIVRTSAFIFLLQGGAYLGYVTFGVLADRIGRRPAFFLYTFGAAVITPLYGSIPRWAGESAHLYLLLLGPVVGFLGTGFFTLFGVMLAELYPTALRGAGQGFVYNIGRGLSALAPFVIGAGADRFGFAAALTLNAAFFLLGSLLVFTLPETRKTELEQIA